MDNVITIFMNYKIKRLMEYGILFYQQDTPFIRRVFSSYFQTFVDNYYYGVFNTIDDEVYNRKNLKMEFTGIMDEMLYDYETYEFSMSPEEYKKNQETIRKLRDLSYEIVRIDLMEFSDKDQIPELVQKLVDENELLSKYVENSMQKLIKLVKDTYLQSKKLLQYQDEYFTLKEKYFMGHDDCCFMSLVPNIKSLTIYRNNLVNKVYEDDKFTSSKFYCLIQKVSLLLLHNFLEKKENKKIFIEIPSECVGRGKIQDKILKLIDNPMFQKNVYLGVPYSLYTSQKTAFAIDYHFACIQDFSHINDIYQKVEDIYQDAFSHYLIVSNCRWEEREYFIEFQNDVLTILVFEEE